MGRLTSWRRKTLSLTSTSPSPFAAICIPVSPLSTTPAACTVPPELDCAGTRALCTTAFSPCFRYGIHPRVHCDRQPPSPHPRIFLQQLLGTLPNSFLWPDCWCLWRRHWLPRPAPAGLPLPSWRAVAVDHYHSTTMGCGCRKGAGGGLWLWHQKEVFPLHGYHPAGQDVPHPRCAGRHPPPRLCH